METLSARSSISRIAGKYARGGRCVRARSERLRALALDLVIDFRTPGEKVAGEDAFGRHFHWVASPVLGGNMALDVLIPKLRESTPAQIHDFMLQACADFPLRYRAAFSGLMHAAQAGKTVLFHCTAGKDRTGFAALLLLSALGVSEDDIVADHLVTNVHARRFTEAALANQSTRIAAWEHQTVE